MPYKVLERSLLARMFRVGVITAAEFSSRAEALGYDPSDVVKMIQLEQSDAGKSLLWEGGFEPGTIAVDNLVEVFGWSPELDVGEVTYFIITADIPSHLIVLKSPVFVQIPVAGGTGETFLPVKVVGQTHFEFTREKLPDTVKVKLGCSIGRSDTYAGAETGTGGGKIEVVFV